MHQLIFGIFSVKVKPNFHNFRIRVAFFIYIINIRIRNSRVKIQILIIRRKCHTLAKIDILFELAKILRYFTINSSFQFAVFKSTLRDAKPLRRHVGYMYGKIIVALNYWDSTQIPLRKIILCVRRYKRGTAEKHDRQKKSNYSFCSHRNLRKTMGFCFFLRSP